MDNKVTPKVKEFVPLKDQQEAFSKEIILERLLKDEAYIKRQLNRSKESNSLKVELRDIKKKINKVFEEANTLWYFKS